MRIVAFFGDHLHLPPVPQSTSLLASLDGASTEHKAGEQCLAKLEIMSVFKPAGRFKDPNWIAILDAMRQPNGRSLSPGQWQALQATEVDLSSSTFSAAKKVQEANGWCHGPWLPWHPFFELRLKPAAITSICFMSQLVTLPKSCPPELLREMLQVYHIHTTTNPSVCLLYVGVKVRFATSVQPPVAVQDATGTVVAWTCTQKQPPRRRSVASFASLCVHQRRQQ